MFRDISELIVLNKNESLGKNDLIILPLADAGGKYSTASGFLEPRFQDSFP